MIIALYYGDTSIISLIINVVLKWLLQLQSIHGKGIQLPCQALCPIMTTTKWLLSFCINVNCYQLEIWKDFCQCFDWMVNTEGAWSICAIQQFSESLHPSAKCYDMGSSMKPCCPYKNWGPRAVRTWRHVQSSSLSKFHRLCATGPLGDTTHYALCFPGMQKKKNTVTAQVSDLTLVYRARPNFACLPEVP